jgi:hypothetical protein
LSTPWRYYGASIPVIGPGPIKSHFQIKRVCGDRTIDNEESKSEWHQFWKFSVLMQYHQELIAWLDVLIQSKGLCFVIEMTFSDDYWSYTAGI